MKHFRAIAPKLFYSFPLLQKNVEELNKLLELLEDSGVWKFFEPESKVDNSIGRPGYDACSIFAVILMGFALRKESLREIRSACENDLRFRFICGEQYPSFSTISRFFQKFIVPQVDNIFSCITSEIFKKCSINMDVAFIDGTKQKAKPNKYKFVWKPTWLRSKSSDKIRNLSKIMGIDTLIPSEGIIHSSLITKLIDQANNLSADNIEGGEKALQKMKESLANYLLKMTEYEEMDQICGPNRNSYYKTDHDATAMCLKEDYYSGLGSNTHPAYSAQIVVSHGFVACYLVTQERSDLYTFIPTLEAFNGRYGSYPKKIGADSGYGYLINYEFCEQNNIQAFIKYQAWNGENSGRSPSLYELQPDGKIICLGNRQGEVAQEINRHPKYQGGVFYKVTGCTGCEFQPYCRRQMKDKTSDERIFEFVPKFIELKQKARDLLLSAEGIAMRVNRSCQVEGVFGMIKQNMAYTRFRRTSMPHVTAEFALTCLGLNIRKYLKFIETKKLPVYWIPPNALEAGKFKKPSAKRLTNRVNKIKEKSANEIARKSGRRKY